MFKNYLRSALQFLKKNKLFTFINTLGLSIALAVSFLIILFVVNETSYDRCHRNRDRVFRVVNYYTEFKQTMSGTPYVLTSALKTDFPQVEKACAVRSVALKLKLGNEMINVYGKGTDSDIFDIFTLPLIGNHSNGGLLEDQKSIVISKSLAEKLFSGENPVGKEVEGLINNTSCFFTVNAVFEDIPENSTFRAECFVSSKWTIDQTNKAFQVTNADVNWDIDFWSTWVLLSDAGQADEVNMRFREFEKKHLGEKPTRNFSLQNLSDVYLKSANIANSGRIGNLKNIRLFTLIAFVIVLIAALNYILLSTTVSTVRTKEIGIRKTSGASNVSIKMQLFSESVLLTLLALPLALVIAELALPYAGRLFQTDLRIIGSNITIYILVFIAITLLIGLISGAYTAGYLSRVKVVSILKSETPLDGRKSAFRSIFIVTQLVIFCTFVTSALIIRSQYIFFLKHDPGYNTQNTLLVDVEDAKDYTAYLNSIKSNPGVIMAGGTMQSLPMNGFMTIMAPKYKNSSEKLKIEGMAVGYNFLKTMGIKVIEGREFSEDYGTDLRNSVILNETAVKQLEIPDPVGKQLNGQTIIGVVKDFNLHSLQSDIPPLYINMTDKYIQQVAIHYTAGSLDNLLPFLKSEWEKLNTGLPFSFSTIDEINKEIYTSEKNLSTIVSLSALFSLLISMLGLFGLTLFIARSRVKEIGIKKVLGSTEGAIVYSFLQKNIVAVLVAALLSVPVTYYFMNRWLNNYAYRIDIEWWFFAVSFGIAMLIVITTVSIHSLRASRINPVEALRYE